MEIIILEDKPLEADRLKTKIREWEIQSHNNVTVTVYSSGESFFSEVSPDLYNNYSVYFLDIQMGGINGIEVAKRLRREGCSRPILFLTAFREYVFHGYDVRAMHYLLKPVEKKSLFLCLDEIAANLKGNFYLYRSKGEIIHIPSKEIVTFSGNRHYVDILTTKDSFCQYTTLNNIMTFLPREFIRVHRSYIVNMAHIYKISQHTITLSNRMTTPIGRSYLKDVLLSFTAYSTRFDRLKR